MLQTVRSFKGAVTAPHHLAARAGSRVLDEGGNAIEAMIAAASTIAAVYPHMNSLGGDNFWLIHTPGKKVVGIDAGGESGQSVDIPFYRNRGLSTIPNRGPLAALTVAGAPGGWQEAMRLSRDRWSGRMPLKRLLEDAIFLATDGVAVTRTQAEHTSAKLHELQDVSGFAQTYLDNGRPPKIGYRFKQPRLANTLKRLGESGLEDFYRGQIARDIAADLQRAGSPLTLKDLENYYPRQVEPLSLKISGHTVYNLPPPTQGLASLLLLGIFDRLGNPRVDSFEYVHNLVESTKCAFRVRDKYVSDPAYMIRSHDEFLDPEALDRMAGSVAPDRAAPWPHQANLGDTVWLSAIDAEGRMVSFIQSIYWEFGSGLVLGETGITWQNRGVSFSLDPDNHNCLQPGRRPFHTIQPALAHLRDGRVLSYGTMGGEGQPQTQAVLFTRHVLHNQELQQAITAPRWLLGRTWGAESTRLRIEDRLDPTIIKQLQASGHDIELVGPFEEIMGHAGALERHPDGLIEGATDPRSDGAVAAC